MTRIGILSVAHLHAFSYAAALQQLPEVDLVGVSDEAPERGQAFADKIGARFFPNHAALLAEGLDGAIICSENVHHRALTELAAPATRHILCEKPIATTVEDAQAMIDVCAQHGAKLQIAFPVRFAPPVASLKKLLDQQVLGRIYSLKTTNHGSMPGGWFVDRALSGGGAVIDHTVHVVDLLRWFWNTEVTEVYAEVGQDLLHPDLGIDDAGMLSFKLATGAYGTLDTSWSRPAAFPTWGDVTIEALGENGWIRLDAFKQQFEVYSNLAPKPEWVFWGSNMDLGLMRDFVQMIVEGREPSITGYDGLKALEVALAAYRSAETGQPVTLAAG
jgi:predicted dehydrogenase